MTYPPRKPLRLPDYDYSQSGAYFITICTHRRARCFGRVIDGQMVTSTIGAIAQACWHTIVDHFAGVELDAFVVMPNHVHGIIWLPGGGAALHTIIGTYKAAVTRLTHRAQLHAPAQIWQSRYYDHVVRHQQALDRIRAYILGNPMRWRDDRLYTNH